MAANSWINSAQPAWRPIPMAEITNNNIGNKPYKNNKIKTIKCMSHLYRPQSTPYSADRLGSDQIKRGLQKIKQAQIEVLRQLGKEDKDISRNQSLTYSKETTVETKATGKNDREQMYSIGKQERMKTLSYESTTVREGKNMGEYSVLLEEVKRYKMAAERAEDKMKEYERSQEKALAKAQEAFANAISSEKKYIALKGEYDKLYKDRDRLSGEVKKYQKKQLLGLLKLVQSEQVPASKIVKQLQSAHQCFTELMGSLSTHKCGKVDSSAKVNTSQSGNSFTISTYDAQAKFDKHLSNIISYFSNLHNFGSMQHNLHNAASGVYGFMDNEATQHLSGSFTEDIRLIQQELSLSDRGKSMVDELKIKNTSSEKKIAKLETEVRQLSSQVNLLKTKLKTIAKENQQNKLAKVLLQQQYEKFQAKTKEKQLKRQDEIEKYKKKLKAVGRSLQVSQSQKSLNSNSAELLEDRVLDLQNQNANLNQKLKIAEATQLGLKQANQKLRIQLENLSKNLNTNTKNQIQYQSMIQNVKKLEKQKQQLNSRLRKQNLKYQSQLNDLQFSIASLKKQLLQLKQEKEDQSQLFNQYQQMARRQSFPFTKAADPKSHRKDPPRLKAQQANEPSPAQSPKATPQKQLSVSPRPIEAPSRTDQLRPEQFSPSQTYNSTPSRTIYYQPQYQSRPEPYPMYQSQQQQQYQQQYQPQYQQQYQPQYQPQMQHHYIGSPGQGAQYQQQYVMPMQPQYGYPANVLMR